MRNTGFYGLLLVFVILIAGCGSDDDESSKSAGTSLAPSPQATRVPGIEPPTERAAVANRSAPLPPLPVLADPSPVAADGAPSVDDPSVFQDVIEIGEPLDADAEPTESSSREVVNLGDVLDADNPEPLFDELTVDQVDLGERLDADAPYPLLNEQTADPVDLGGWLDADAPNDDPAPSAEPIELGAPRDASLESSSEFSSNRLRWFGFNLYHQS